MRRTYLAIVLLLAGTTIAQAEDQKSCEALLDKAGFGTGLLKGQCLGDRFCLVVSERIWNQLDYNAKFGLANTVDCVIAGSGNTLTEFRFRSDRTNKVLGTWSWGKLEVE